MITSAPSGSVQPSARRRRQSLAQGFAPSFLLRAPGFDGGQPARGLHHPPHIRVHLAVGFGRSAASEIAAPIMLANLVWSGCAVMQSGSATEPNLADDERPRLLCRLQLLGPRGEVRSQQCAADEGHVPTPARG